MSLDTNDSASGSDGEVKFAGELLPQSWSLDYRHTDTRTLLVDTRDSLDVTDEPLMVRVAYRYLTEVPATTWATWDISRPGRRLLAARWLADQIEAVEVLLRHTNV
jgi:hypothetical protein